MAQFYYGDSISPSDQSLKTTDTVEFAQIDNTLLNMAANSGADFEVTGTAGWKDILGAPNVRGSGSNDPAFNSPTGFSNLRFFEFPGTGPMKEIYFYYHIPHDWADGTDFYFHVHHFPEAASPSGVVRWNFEYTFAGAPGTTDDTFSTSTTVITADETYGSSDQYKHFITETTAQTLTDITVDGIIVCRVYRDPALGADTSTDSAFILTCDLHYQCNKLVTKNKADPFYA